MNKIITGNLDTQIASHPETKGWFLGCFMEKNPDFLSDDVEVKWGRHPKGEIKKGYDAIVPTKTLVILISGYCVVRFAEFKQESVLAKLGDYVFFDASTTSHVNEAKEDSLVLVVRYPSKR